MEESFERAMLQKLYSLEKLSLRLLDKIQKTETGNLKLLGEIHARVNEVERDIDKNCNERKEKLQAKIDGLRELLYASEGDASKTRETFSSGLSAKFKDVYGKIDDLDDLVNSRTSDIRVLETQVSTHLNEENSRFGKYATIVSIVFSLLALAGMITFGIIQSISKS